MATSVLQYWSLVHVAHPVVENRVPELVIFFAHGQRREPLRPAVAQRGGGRALLAQRRRRTLKSFVIRWRTLGFPFPASADLGLKFWREYLN